MKNTVYTRCKDEPYTHCKDEPYTHCKDEPYTHCKDESYTHCKDEPYTRCKDEVRVGVASSLSNARKTLLFDLDLPIDVFTDSEGAQAIAANSVYHKWTKHIDIKYHYIREKILDGTVCVNEVGSKNNLADVFTKPIARDQHQILTSRIGLVGNPIEGGC